VFWYTYEISDFRYNFVCTVFILMKFFFVVFDLIGSINGDNKHIIVLVAIIGIQVFSLFTNSVAIIPLLCAKIYGVRLEN